MKSGRGERMKRGSGREGGIKRGNRKKLSTTGQRLGEDGKQAKRGREYIRGREGGRWPIVNPPPKIVRTAIIPISCQCKLVL
jgi:hypothetical protein